MLARVNEKITEVRALGVKPMQVQTVRELSMYLGFLDPNTKLQLDGVFPTLVKRPGALGIERWSDDEVVRGHFCNDDHCG
jgi:hypothetical protein